MELTRRNLLVYGLILGVWLLVVGWQLEEHVRVREAAKADLRGRSKDIANTLSAILRNIRFRQVIPEERLKNLLDELVNGRTNELVKSSELISIELRNQYVIGYKPSNLVRDGRWRRIKVKLAPPRGLPPLQVYARTGYYAPTQ